MSQPDLSQLVEQGELEAFEARCLEQLEQGRLRLGTLLGPLRRLQLAGKLAQFCTLGQMALENTDWDSEPQAALEVARLLLAAEPDNRELRQLTVEAFRRAHADTPGIEGLLAASGLSGARPARSALNTLDFCLALRPGDALLSRAEDLVVEVRDVDRQRGLVTLGRQERSTTTPLAELARGYERLRPDDFRALRHLRPERLSELARRDPLALVIGLIRSQGDALDADTLRQELVPQPVPAEQWPRWWSRTRSLLRRCPQVIVAGRAPVLLRYCAAGRTLEQEASDAFAAGTEPSHWLRTIEGYLRQKRQRKQPPDPGLLERLRAELLDHFQSVRSRRPGEALATALVIKRLARGQQAGQAPAGAAASPAGRMLREAADPAALLARLSDETFWSLALDTLLATRPQDAPQCAARLIGSAPAALLDRLVAIALEAGLRCEVQQRVDEALADPLHHPDLICWLWQGPQPARPLSLPPVDEVFSEILDALSALARSGAAGSGAARGFRQKMRSALGLHDFAQVRACLERVSAERAVTLRRQLERLEGVGDKTRTRMLGMLRQLHPRLWAEATRRPRPWEDPETLWTTAAGLARRTQQRDHLLNVTMRENARRIGEAAAHGDLSENSEYKFALEERDLLRARLARMNAELAKARVLEPHQVPADHVGVGSRVTLRSLSDGSERVMTFLGPFDADVERGVYSYLAPLAQQLMGRRVGQRLTLTLDGRQIEFELSAIDNGLAAAG